ncbi:3'-5' exonuclease [Sphingobacterium detergens]|uniref:3'-5' exonuclease n=1 Tax=Sphingobacterium detergens TaxID=1145106 RepID=UPI003AAE6050
MIALILDTETNGRPKKRGLDYKETTNWPRITQLSWVLIDATTGYVYSQHNHIIKPDGWTVPTVEECTAAGEKNPTFFQDNNISTERCENEGIPIQIVLALLINDLTLADIYVNHNLEFDYNVTVAEMERYNMWPKSFVKTLCTMQTTKDILKLPGYYGDHKLPSLQELHKYLFTTEFDGNHDAMADVMATARCFIELIKRGHYKI